MASTCCLVVSRFSGPLRLLLTATPARLSSAPRSLRSPRKRRGRGRGRLPSRIPAASPQPPPLKEGEGEGDADEDERYGFQIQVSKVGKKRNRRLVRARVRVDAPLEAVWATLTDYEGLADFIPGLSECRLLQQDQEQGLARLYQVGEQDLALGFKFNAKGTIDCYEGPIQVGPRTRRRDIAFNMTEGDFKLFQGKWSVQEGIVEGAENLGEDQQEEFQFQTTLFYLVELEPKLWVPVTLLEGRICSEIKTNLVSIREQAQRIRGRC